MTAADYADAVSRAVRTLCRHMDDASPNRSLKAATEVVQLECHRLRHGRDVVGTTPRESGFPGSADVSSARLPQARAFHEYGELSDPGSQSGRDVRAPREDAPDIDLDFLAQAIDPAILAALEAGQ